MIRLNNVAMLRLLVIILMSSVGTLAYVVVLYIRNWTRIFIVFLRFIKVMGIAIMTEVGAMVAKVLIL